MKNFLVFSVLLCALGSPLFTSVSFAQGGPANPGDEPNERNRNNGPTTESTVVADGIHCRDCKTRILNKRLHDNTAAGHRSSTSPATGKSTPKDATQ